jgi:ATP-dependent phosphofructokinase / diphosphate-dependent phosphofructokinase
MTKRIALITGGGDCPGINAFLASVIRRAIKEYDAEVWGIMNAFEGLSANNPHYYLVPMTLLGTTGLENRSSTILESSRFNPFNAKNKENKVPERIIDNLANLKIDGILGTGGNDTILSAMHLEQMGIPIVMAPKSIDNDISGTDVMLGFRTAISFGAQAARSTADSAIAHRRISLVEVMGRQAGWLALDIGVASGADIITIPERPVTLSAFCDAVRKIYYAQNFVNIVVAEGTSISYDDPIIKMARKENKVINAMLDETPEIDSFGNPKLGGVSQILRRVLLLELGLSKLEEIRTTDLGFTLRGLIPVADDIILGTKFGIKAADILLGENRSGVMVGINGLEIKEVPFKDALKIKLITQRDTELEALGVFIS